MKKSIALLAMMAFISCSQAQPKAFSDEALAEKLLSFDGNQVSFQDILKKHKGKTLVIEVWASWCSDCVKAMPLVKNMQSTYPKADFVFISMDKAAFKWKEGIKKHELTGDHYWANDGMKGKFGTEINLDWIPRYIIISKDGDVLMYRGIETDFDQINKLLNRMEL